MDVNPPSGTRSEFTVVTPMTVAAVRGTSFDMDTRNLRVTNGTVVYRGTNGAPVTVNAGGSSAVNESSGKAADPLVIQRQELVPPMPISGPAGGDGSASGPVSPNTGASAGAASDGGFGFTLP